MPNDDPEFQELLEEPALYPNILAELPGVLLKDEDADIHVVKDDPEPDLAELAAAALDNAGINANNCLQAAQWGQEPGTGPALIEGNDDKIVYEITFDLPDAGLAGNNVVPVDNPPPEAPPKDPTVHNLAAETVDLLTDTGASPRQCPTRLRRSVTIYTPQTTFHTPRTTFLLLQQGEVQAHRSIVNATRYTKATKEERMHATT